MPSVAPAPAGNATLAGRVFRDDGSGRQSVARVIVSLGLGDGRRDRQTASDDEGRFAFDGLAPGRYLLTASKAGWVTSYYGSPLPGRPPGVRVAVADGAKVNVEIPIVPGGVIAGRITDEDGRPMPWLSPWVLESRLFGDRRMLGWRRNHIAIGSFERGTDDEGEFRLFGLPPGTYYLRVTPLIASGARVTTSDDVRWALQPPGAASPPQAGPVMGYAPVYFPGTIDPSAAQPIVVGPGEVREGLQFRVPLVRVARVEGTVQRADGTPAAGARVGLDARVPQVNVEGTERSATADPNGRFVFQNVPPGDYRISARATPPAGASAPQSPLLWGQADVVVGAQDVQGVGLTVAPASVMTGRLTFSATNLVPPADLKNVRLQFIAVDALATALTGSGSSTELHNATVAADGTFRIAGLPPDRYSVTATWPGMRTGDGTSGWWLTTVLVGGRDIGDLPLEVRPNEDVPDVTIGFRDRIGAVEGVLLDPAGRPAPEYFVLAFSTDRASWTTTSRRAVPAVRPGTDGRFRVPGLPAGEYYLAVVTAVEPDEAMDPEFLAAILPGAIRITVRDGETRRQDLKIGRAPAPLR